MSDPIENILDEGPEQKHVMKLDKGAFHVAAPTVITVNAESWHKEKKCLLDLCFVVLPPIYVHV